MKSITLITAIKKALELSREGYRTTYFIVDDANGESVKIRVADHQGKKSNNKGTKTISFITSDKIENGFGFDRIEEEYMMDEDNYTDTYQSIEQVLDWADIDADTKDYLCEKIK